MTQPTIEATGVIVVLFLLALFGAWVVFRFLKTTVRIEQKGLQLTGAGAMFILMFVLLNRYLPQIRDGLFEESRAAQPIEKISAGSAEEIATVTLSPAVHLLTRSELDHLDRNQYIIDEALGVALPRVRSTHWEEGHFQKLPLIGIEDIPTMSSETEYWNYMVGQPDPPIIGIQSVETQSVTLYADSTLDGMPMNFNLFGDPSYIARVLAGRQLAAAALGVPILPPSKDALAIYTKGMKKLGAAEIARSLPVVKTVRNGVFILPFKRKLLGRSIFHYTGRHSLLEQAILVINYSSGFGLGSLRNYYIDQERGIASFNASVHLRNVGIRSRRTDAILNTVGFVVAGSSRAVLVVLTYFSTTSIDEYQRLHAILDSLRFTG